MVKPQESRGDFLTREIVRINTVVRENPEPNEVRIYDPHDYVSEISGRTFIFEMASAIALPIATGLTVDYQTGIGGGLSALIGLGVFGTLFASYLVPSKYVWSRYLSQNIFFRRSYQRALQKNREDVENYIKAKKAHIKMMKKISKSAKPIIDQFNEVSSHQRMSLTDTGLQVVPLVEDADYQLIKAVKEAGMNSLAEISSPTKPQAIEQSR